MWIIWLRRQILILNATNISKSFGSNEIIKDANFLVNEHEKVAIVGVNGAGKTTLLKILTGEEHADSGNVILAKDAKLGYCGTKTEKSATERALICSKCKNIEYPKISPAVIVAIRNGNKLLLTKNAKGTYKYYALVAGFVEVGETLEEAVAREVKEEVGLKVKNIRPYKSQPWSFSDTMMLAFIADLDGDDKITLQEEELSEARWFEREDVPVLPFHISVGHEMIQKFRDGEI